MSLPFLGVSSADSASELGTIYGWRRSELLGLTVEQCDFKAAIIRLEVGSTKNGEGREVPMTPAVAALLKQCCTSKKAADRVLTREGGGPVQDPRVAWWALCCRAGLGKFVCRTEGCGHEQTSRARCPQCRVVNWKYVGLLLHDLRRTAARNLRQVGVSEHVAMTITGHKTAAMFRRYAIVNNDDKRAALARLAEGRSDLKVALKTGQQVEAGSTKVQ